MLKVAQKYKMMETNPGTAYFPFANSATARIYLSTRRGNAIIDWGDGSSINVTSSKNFDNVEPSYSGSRFEHNYSPNFTGNVSFYLKLGLADVYSILIGGAVGYTHPSWDIQDFASFIRQFPNLYSLKFNFYSYQNPTGKVIKGDLASIPDSVERMNIGDFEIMNNTTDVWFDISTLKPTSRLRYFLFANTSSLGITRLRIIGDVSNLPIGCTYFNANAGTIGSITYTAGKTWPSAFDTLSIPLVLTTAELDALLVDMANSITSAVGGKVITLGGYRSFASDAGVAYLQGLGFTVNIARGYKLLDLPFQNSFADSGEMGMTMIAGNGNGVPLFTTGRKGNDFAINFTGNRSIKTNIPFPINTNQMTISAWIKRNTTNAGMFLEMGEDAAVVGNSFYCYLPGGNTMEIRDVNNADNTIRVNFNMTNWNHIVIVFDRSLDNQNNIKIWVNNSLLVKSFILNGDVNGNYLGKTLYIGQRAGTNLPFEGLVQYLKIWNKALTATEVTNLYNSEL